MDGIEAAGEVVTGGLLARAIEPGAGEAADGHTQERNCLNCRTKLTGPYCSTCGQKAHVHRSVRGFLQDFVQGLVNFEGKIWRTLPMLAWRPGEMTRRYISGERARFISPVALYLFTVFAMFAVLNFTGSLGSGGGGNVSQAVSKELAENRHELIALQSRRKLATVTDAERAAVDREITKREQDIAQAKQFLDGKTVVTTKIERQTPRWVRPLVKNMRDNPDLVAVRVQDAASKYSWMLIPISVPFLWLLFPLRRRYNTYDHTVFVTYSLSFMMMLVIAGGLLILAGLPGLVAILLFVPPLHMYRHLKQAYELGRFSAIMRTTALLTFAFIAASLFLATAAAIGAA